MREPERIMFKARSTISVRPLARVRDPPAERRDRSTVAAISTAASASREVRRSLASRHSRSTKSNVPR